MVTSAVLQASGAAFFRFGSFSAQTAASQLGAAVVNGSSRYLSTLGTSGQDSLKQCLAQKIPKEQVRGVLSGWPMTSPDKQS